MLCGTIAATLMCLGRARTVSRYWGKVSKLQSMPARSVCSVHALDERQGLDDQLAVVGSSGSDAESAVALDHGRDPVPGRRRQIGIPEDLRVEVGVDVDEAGAQHQAGEVDVLAVPSLDLADPADAVIDHLDVGSTGRTTRPVDQRGTS